MENMCLSKVEKVVCPLCNSKDFKNVAFDNVLGKDFSVLECNSCSLLRTYPQIKPEEFEKYYTEDYLPYVQEKGIFKVINKQLFRIQSRSFRNLKKGSTILEVGCSYGNFLSYIKAKGYNVYGIEPGENAAQRAREAGLDVETVSLEDYQTDKKFDLIIMRHVLEHLADPVTSLKKMSGFLNDNGRIYCILPNSNAVDRKIFKNDWYAWQIPFHFFHYNNKTIRLLAEKSGIGVLSVSYSYLPIVIIRSIGSKLERKGFMKMATFFQGNNPITSVTLLPFSFVSGLAGKSGVMSVLFSKENNRNISNN